MRQLIEGSRKASSQALFAMCGLAGLRCSEALSVTRKNVHLNTVSLRIVGKGSVERVVPISDEALMPIMRAYALAAYGPLVPITGRGARALCHSTGERILGHSVATHDLRMTFGTAVYAKYGLREAQELLGHSSSKTTEGYTLVTNDRLREAVNL